MASTNACSDGPVLYPMTQNPLTRVLDILGRDFASHPPAPMPPVLGPKTGQLRSREEISHEKGFSSVSDMQCRMAEVDVGLYSRSAALRRWYYTDGSKAGLEALINTQFRFFAPQTTVDST
ncbi:hypothetical protein FHR70_002759 [Microvirga lupini]|uniref:Uncharacterized protein n=1 Tax=Microvirga lupini TaxID=420324 RepID=A0A7W4VM31_9HYPH|nr:hypothetical protein [Microvirga lupini]MBB3019694.1 hypothetical protein [Microvirga lupini]